MKEKPTKVYIVMYGERVANKYSSNCFYLRQSDAKKKAGKNGKVLEATLEWKEVNYEQATDI